MLYLNGIAIGVLELKTSRVSIGDGIRQSLSNQQPEFHQWFFSTVQFVLGVSKPHPDFFLAALHAIRRHRPRIRLGEITHIGDHPVCDLVGAVHAGMTAVLVRSPRRYGCDHRDDIEFHP